MRFRHPSGQTVRLSYLSNVHPAPDVRGICDGLRRFAAPIRARLDVDVLGIGLFIPAAAALELTTDTAALERLRDALRVNRLEVIGLNGFPVQMYQAGRKYGAFRPDWAESERLAHTLRLARILAEIMPSSAQEGCISTLPLLWRTRADTTTRRAALDGLERLSEGLSRLCDETGRAIRVGLEPEPGCAIETVDEAVDLLSGKPTRFGALGLGADDPWIGLCVDTAHMAVQFETAGDVLSRASAASIPVFKLQLANGLAVSDPLRADWLAGYVEPDHIHQVRERRADGVVYGVDDLSTALAGGLPGDGEWRVHYHFPIFLDEHSTQSTLRSALQCLLSRPEPVGNIEIETYTWTLLPEELRPKDDEGLIEGLTRELAWARDRMLELGLRPK
ncbi:MAG: hypothetical protein V7607_2636 [Solirubrobacteraceae bacterium]